MTRVNINGAGHQIEVDHNSEDLGYVIEKAQKLWEQTKPPDRVPVGFGNGEQPGVAR